MREVKVINMTSLFSKDMLIYSLFDLRLKSPLKIIGVLYFIILFIIIGVPTFMIAWPPNVYSVFIGVGIPFGGAVFMSKPIWNGKSFFSFFMTQLRYLTRPRNIYDWKPRSKNTIHEVDSKILVSRHKDFNELYLIVKKEEAIKYG